ncbi:MAG: protein translocase subunit SecF [bacterium]|nr:protein translocase subunit SecF [bacterium]
MNFVKHKNIFFIISGILILPGLISLFTKGLKLGIDFTGGTLMEIRSDKFNASKKEEIQELIKKQDVEVSSVQLSGDNAYIIRAKEFNQSKNNQVMAELNKKYEKVEESRFETVGPTIGSELTRNAILALIVSSTFIVLFIAYSFRTVPKPASSFRFGITAVAALLHDALFILGVFSILGWTLNVEVDSLFVTALLTVIGFSVHDTIVVYDRIRENLIKVKAPTFEDTVNLSIWETLARSINTSTTVIIVLLALLLFGGESIRWFVFALLIGIVSGTYSSIFNAAQLLVVWQDYSDKKKLS